MLKSPKKMALVFFPAYDWAISPTHPEREERLLYTQDQIAEEGLLDIEGIREYRPDIAVERDVERVHFCVPDVKSRTTESHMISAGGAIKAAKLVLSHEADCAFALVRPPGHHSMRVVHGNRGFCNINIEAIMIEYIRDAFGVDRVAVVDTDCHHGDGTQDIYWHDPDTLFISLHQDGRTLYPGSGFIDELGGLGAYGTTLNVPLPPFTSDDGYLYVMDHLVLPVLEEFRPEIIVNSAGQDNHYSDPITNMMLTAQGYAELNRKLSPHIAVLEGGYSIEGALPYVNTGIILAMAGMDFSHVKEPDRDLQSFKPQREIMDYCRELCGKLTVLWEHRRENAVRLRGVNRYDEQARTIFYDTDGITEYQQERLRLCGDCPGSWVIDSSSAETGYRIRAVHVPRKSCPDCRKEALGHFQGASKSDFDRVFLQDRQDKIFETR
ncbi:MAG: histone deacetylase [Candidatus Eremiobacteraeota bacterium]|nr:histone deacetylase [Candidatus Eremiobacteraeota bacterium]